MRPFVLFTLAMALAASEPDPAWMGQINARSAQAAVPASAPTVIVGVIDAGFRTGHATIAPALLANPGETPGDGVDNDRNGHADDLFGWDMLGDRAEIPNGKHGTMVAGALALAGGAGIRLVVCHAVGSQLRDGSPIQLARALDYLRERGARVINMSLSSEPDPRLHEALQRCRQADIMIVIAAGNSGVDLDLREPFWPEADNIVVVGGVDEQGRRSSLSFGNARVHLAAPAVDLRLPSSTSDTAWTQDTGTSFAAPQVAATLALLARKHPGEPARTLIARVLATVRSEPTLAGYVRTGGVLDMAAALDSTAPATFRPRVDVLRPGATRAAGLLPSDGHSTLSWSWRCPDDGPVRLTASGSKPTITVATADSQPIAHGSIVEFPGRRGTSYLVTVEAGDDGSGEAGLRLSRDPPPNHRLSRALELPSTSSVRHAWCTTWSVGDAADTWISFAGQRPLQRPTPEEMQMQDRRGRKLGRIRLLPPRHPLWFTWKAPRSGTARIGMPSTDHPAGLEVLSCADGAWQRRGVLVPTCRPEGVLELSVVKDEVIYLAIAVLPQPEMWQIRRDGSTATDGDGGIATTGTGDLQITMAGE